MSRIKLLPVFLFVAFFLAACDTAVPAPGEPMTQSPLLAALERKSGLIAYMGVDGNIYTINQGGSDEQAITSDAQPAADNAGGTSLYYLFPTWSPDSDKLAFMELLTENGSQHWRVLTTPVTDPTPAEIYKSDLAPIYMNWSPDNENIAMITSAPSGGLLLQMASAQNGEARPIDAGSPFYWDWAPDGHRLLIHSGSAAAPRLAILTPQERVIEEIMAIRPSRFQSPDWSPDGRFVLFTTTDESGENSLTMADSQAEEQTPLASSENPFAFAWSPDGEKVAYIDSAVNLAQGVLGPLTVLGPQKPDETITAAGDRVAAFFWSPDSKKIAYFIPQQVTSEENSANSSESTLQNLVLNLRVLDVATGESESLLTYQPTVQFVNLLPYFDQYQRSTTIWSPDSKNLVVTGYPGTEAPQILIVSASGRLQPRSIGLGWLAFWSWK